MFLPGRMLLSEQLASVSPEIKARAIALAVFQVKPA
jgi:hypothetical protein